MKEKIQPERVLFFKNKRKKGCKVRLQSLLKLIKPSVGLLADLETGEVN